MTKTKDLLWYNPVPHDEWYAGDETQAEGQARRLGKMEWLLNAKLVPWIQEHGKDYAEIDGKVVEIELGKNYEPAAYTHRPRHSKYHATPVRVDNVGAVSADGIAYVVLEYKNVAILEIDLDTKYAEYSGNSAKDICLCKGGRTLSTTSATEDITVLSFPEFQHLDVYMLEISRYTCRVVLKKA